MLERILNRRRYLKVAKQASRAGESVSAVMGQDGKWKYFSVPPDSTDAEVRALAFEQREGRPMNRLEQQLNNLTGVPQS